MFFCYLWLSNIVVVSGMVNLISLWYSLMYRDLCDIWFLGSSWLTRDGRGDFVALIVGSQEPSGEWVKHSNKLSRALAICSMQYIDIINWPYCIVL